MSDRREDDDESHANNIQELNEYFTSNDDIYPIGKPLEEKSDVEDDDDDDSIMDQLTFDDDYQSFLESLLHKDDDTMLLPEEEEDDVDFTLQEETEDDDDSALVSKKELNDMVRVSKQEFDALLQDMSKHPVALSKASTTIQLDGPITSKQRIQFASQMAKHVQLLYQHMAQTDRFSSECTNMLGEIQARAQESQVRLLNISTERSKTKAPAKTRRVTRSLTIHPAVLYPSAFDVMGINAVDHSPPVARIKSLLSSSGGCTATIEEDDNTNLDGPSSSPESFATAVMKFDKHMLPRNQHELSLISAHGLDGIEDRDEKSELNFSKTEHRLLERGVLAHGGSDASLEKVKERFLPGKSVSRMKVRLRFLRSKKAPDAAMARMLSKDGRVNKWQSEEDVALVKGIIKFYGQNGVYSQISRELIPHRSRGQIRKRWSRINRDFKNSETGELNLEKMKDFIRKNDTSSFSNLVSLGPSPNGSDIVKTKLALKTGPYRMEENKILNKNLSIMHQGVFPPTTFAAAKCSLWNLHPSVYYGMWSRFEPATILENMCRHNWHPNALKSYPLEPMVQPPQPPVTHFHRQPMLVNPTSFPIVAAAPLPTQPLHVPVAQKPKRRKRSTDKVAKPNSTSPTLDQMFLSNYPTTQHQDDDNDDDFEMSNFESVTVPVLPSSVATVRTSSSSVVLPTRTTTEEEHHGEHFETGVLSDSESESDFEQEELLSSSEDDESDEYEREELFSDDEMEENKRPSSSSSSIIAPTPRSLSWTKDEDRTLLIAAKKYGATVSTWQNLTEGPLRNKKAPQAVQDRYLELKRMLVQAQLARRL